MRKETGFLPLHEKKFLFALFFLALAVFLPSNANAANNVSTCGTLGSANTYYMVNTSLSSPGATCLTITRSNVTVDCKPYGAIYSITGNLAGSTYGIYSNGNANVTIKNCIIDGFDSSVYLEGTSDNVTIYASTLNASNREVYVVGSNARIYSNLLSNGGDGVDFQGDNVVIFNNTILNSVSEGVMADDLGLHSNVNISYNVIQNATDSCLYLQVQNSYIHNNTCSGSQLEGIWFKGGSTNNYVYGNWVWNTTAAIAGSLTSSFVYGNTLLNNTRTPGGALESAGIYLPIGSQAGGNRIFNNVIYNNTYGILLNGSSSNTIYNNNVSYNSLINMLFSCRKIVGTCSNSDAVNNVVLNNTLQGGAYGFYDIGWSSATLLSNTFFNNSISGASNSSVFFDGASGNTVVDSTLAAPYSSGGVDIRLNNGAVSNNFLNVSLNQSAVAFLDGSSSITLKWYLNVLVLNNQTGQPVAGAIVNISDANNISVGYTLTGSTGYIAQQNITGYTQNQAGITNATPHNITATKSPPNSTIAYITQNTLVTLTTQSSQASGASLGGSNPAGASNLTNTTWGGWSSAGGAAVAGGNVTNATLNAQSQTWKWCGFYGDIYANLTLKDAAGNAFYYWRVLNVSGAVTAIQNSSPAWDLVDTLPLTGAQVDAAFFPSDTSAADNATQTFNSTSWGGIVAGKTITSGVASAGFRPFGAGNWNVEAINVSIGNTVNASTGFVANINRGQTLYNGGTGDYEMMVPARNPALTSVYTYYFFVQLT